MIMGRNLITGDLRMEGSTLVAVLVLLMMATGVNPQSTVSDSTPTITSTAPTTTSRPTTEPPIVIRNCPTEGVTAYTPRLNETVQVRWNMPYSQGIFIIPVTTTPSGTEFGLGITEVVYNFTSETGTTAQCVFNVTVRPQCQQQTDIPCSNGVCVPSTAFCDGYNDCADSSSGSDENCPLNNDCIAAAPMVFAACADVSPWINATDATPMEGTSTEFRFSAPSTATTLTALTEIRVHSSVLDLQRKELFSATVFITIFLPDSMQTEIVRLYAQYAEIGDFYHKGILRRSLFVHPKEQIIVSIEFDDNILMQRPAFPVDSTCLDCVSVRYGTLRPGCDDNNCLAPVYRWRSIVSMATSNPGSLPCGRAELNGIIFDHYASCLMPPTFEFVTPSQSSYINDAVVLRCVAGDRLVPPSVVWYDENNAVQASGMGYAAFHVSVSREPQSFTCVLDGSTANEETVTVSEWSDDCNALQIDLASYMSSPCLQTETLYGNAVSQEPGVTVSSFSTQQPIVAYRFSMAADTLNPVNPEVQGPAGNLLLPVLLEISPALGRQRRNINSAEIYTRVYEQLYVPVFGTATFDLDPPVMLDAGSQMMVTVVVLESRGMYVEQPPPPPSTLEVVTCIMRGDNPCDSFLQGWSQAQLALLDAGCSSKGNLSLPAYQICHAVSTAEPRIVAPPQSVDITLMPGREGLPEGRTTLTCGIENAVEFSWYKVAPVTGRSFIKKGSTLSISFSSGQGIEDQGSYVCVGKGGRPYENITLETAPATVTVKGFTLFKLTATLANRVFSANLTNTSHPDYGRLRDEFRGQIFLALFENAGLNAPAEFEGISFREGSVIVDAILYVGSTGMADAALADFIVRAVEAIPPGETVDFVDNSIMLVSLVSCPLESVVGYGGSLTFNQTTVGQSTESAESCPPNSFFAGSAWATRECVGNLLTAASWMEPVILDCFGGENVNLLLEDLSAIEVTQDNVEEIAAETVLLTSEPTLIDTSGIVAIANILENIVEAGSPSSQVAVDIVEAVNNILEVDEETYIDLGEDNSPSRILLGLESYITSLQMSGAAGNLTQVFSNLAVLAVFLPQDSLRLGLGFAAVAEGSGSMDALSEADVAVYYDSNSIPIADVNASISLPSQILDYFVPGKEVPVSFFLYVNSKLFRSPSLGAAAVKPQDKFKRAVGSNIISATVEGVRIENLPTGSPVVSTFLPSNVSGPEETVNGSECVFWNFTLNGGFGDWSSEGCERATDNNSRIVCRCNHLTSFAVIVDIYGNQDNVALSIISKIGCAVSIVALIITIATYLAIKKLRTKRPQQILVSFSFALLGLYLVFLVGIEATGSGAGCTIVAVLIHYFTLAAIAWMAVEAANMYLLFVKVLNANVSHFMIKASIAGWGLPLVVVVIILAVDHTNYGNENYCFLRPDNALYFGQILLIGLVLLFNFVIFTLVMRQLTCARKSISSTADKSKREEVMRRLSNAVCISVLLGLTWVFGLLSLIQTANLAFQVLFCIFNSLQGLMIFLLFCVRQEEIRRAWVDFLLCRWRKGRAGDYSKGTASRSRDQLDSQGRATIPLTHQSTNTTNTS